MSYETDIASQVQFTHQIKTIFDIFTANTKLFMLFKYHLLKKYLYGNFNLAL